MTPGPSLFSLNNDANLDNQAVTTGRGRSNLPRRSAACSTRRTRQRTTPSPSSPIARSDHADRRSGIPQSPHSSSSRQRTTPGPTDPAIELDRAVPYHAHATTLRKHQGTSRRRRPRRPVVADDAPTARVDAPKPPQATSSDPVRELAMLYRSFQRQFKQAELRLRASQQQDTAAGTSTVTTPPSHGPSRSTSPGHMRTTNRSFCWGELQSVYRGLSQPVRGMEGSVWHDHDRRQHMLDKLADEPEHVPVPVAPQPGLVSRMGEHSAKRHRRSRRALTAHIRVLQRQISDMKAGVKTVDCGTQVHQFAFVSEQGSQTRPHDSSTPHVLPRGCVLVKSPAPSTTATVADKPTPRSTSSKAASVSPGASTADHVTASRRRLRAELAQVDLVRSSGLDAPPGRFAVGKLVRSLPYDMGAALLALENKLYDPDEDSFTRIHRITAIWSHTDCRGGFEVCQLKPAFPCLRYKHKKTCESRYLVPVTAEDYAAAERKYHKYVRRDCAIHFISRETGLANCASRAAMDTISSLVNLDWKCVCAGCKGVPLGVLVGCGSVVTDAPRCYRDRFQAPMKQLLSEHLDRLYSKMAVHGQQD